ncbi:hypothetical protein PR202_ga20966 [Eleusine coracana subsp. coracana]|uniref:Uncharacterized protein n=1 Tax=Eleusine coracana subsp. coracana TaxID=191504 RepID=A0AAV5CZE9_ELECO|nr:hypothetical protein PR202_ga20966 [Eleusine coracana subsp. coracana]
MKPFLFPDSESPEIEPFFPASDRRSPASHELADKWFLGYSLVELAPTVVKAVALQTQKIRTVAEAMMDHEWTDDI